MADPSWRGGGGRGWGGGGAKMCGPLSANQRKMWWTHREKVTTGVIQFVVLTTLPNLSS